MIEFYRLEWRKIIKNMCNFAENFMMMRTIITTLLLTLCLSQPVVASQVTTSHDTVAADTTTVGTTVQQKSGGGNIFKRIVGYIFEDTTKRKQEDNKRVKFSLVGGPNYASDTKLGLGVAGMLQYRLKGGEAPMNPSYATIAGNATIAGFWSVSLSGMTFVDGGRIRIGTDWWLGYSPRDFYGWGFDNCDNDNRKGKLHQLEIKIKEEVLWRVTNNFYAGPVVEWDYNRSGTVEPEELIEDHDHVVRNYGAGFTLQLDSRDVPTNASRGVHIYLCELFRPKFMGNKYHFATTDFRASWYHTAWRDAIVAAELRTVFNFGKPSWAMMALLGNSSFMRGYYKGRYRDNHLWATQVELRQHIWRHSGIVVWAGGGNVFHDGKSLQHFLPNWGFGYRFAFRKNMNLRLDMGFGKSGQHGFNFSVNEAF